MEADGQGGQRCSRPRLCYALLSPTWGMHLDTAGKGVLDPEARNTLRESLWDPDAFLAELRGAIPKLNKLMD